MKKSKLIFTRLFDLSLRKVLWVFLSVSNTTKKLTYYLQRHTRKSVQPPMNNLFRHGVSVVKDGAIFVDGAWVPSDMTEQFLGDADTYHERYFNRLDFDLLVALMLQKAQIGLDKKYTVLDIGSGGGSSVFSTLRLMPESNVYASDISPPLLKILSNLSLQREEFRQRVQAYCFDLHRPFFVENTFDVVIGCAILHHLTNPAEALKNVIFSLKTGGKLILCEPLEGGNLVNLFLYDTVLELDREYGDPNDKRLSNLMRAMRLDLQVRQGPPVEKPWTSKLDDKWIFDTSFFSELASLLACTQVEIFPAQENLSHVFETSFMSLLADSGNADIVLPKEIVNFLRQVDSGIDISLKQRLCPTGIIVLTK
jgi:SAM-dependent methyltransferase